MPIPFMELISSYKETTSLCDAKEAAQRIRGDSALAVVDVREPAEFEAMSVPGAVNIPRGFLEFKIAESCPRSDQQILLHCKTGGRAVLAAKTLSEMGYKNVSAYQGTVEELLAALE